MCCKFNQFEIVSHEFHKSSLLIICLTLKTLIWNILQMTQSTSWEIKSCPYNFHLLKFHFYIYDHLTLINKKTNHSFMKEVIFSWGQNILEMMHLNHLHLLQMINLNHNHLFLKSLECLCPFTLWLLKYVYQYTTRINTIR